MNTQTEFVVMAGQNLPNHSESLAGRAKFVRISGYSTNNSLPIVRTREAAYRLAAHLICAAQGLPNEEEIVSWDDMLEAVLVETNTNELDLEPELEEVNE